MTNFHLFIIQILLEQKRSSYAWKGESKKVYFHVISRVD